jgi:hypothetical protein
MWSVLRRSLSSTKHRRPAEFSTFREDCRQSVSNSVCGAKGGSVPISGESPGIPDFAPKALDSMLGNFAGIEKHCGPLRRLARPNPADALFDKTVIAVSVNRIGTGRIPRSNFLGSIARAFQMKRYSSEVPAAIFWPVPAAVKTSRIA